jgi:SAM-dependent methyltransferase
MTIEFTAHNIRLDDGSLTKPDFPFTMENYPWFISTRRILNTVFPGDRRNVRIADLGCLEGGYSVEFARMGFQVLGVEVRDANIEACKYAKSKTNLPNLEFVKDNAWNIGNYGTFDVIFCCGLLYHLDKPKQFLQMLSSITTKLLVVQTHFSTQVDEVKNDPFILSPLTENEGLMGRWFTEYTNDAEFRKRETTKWASWDNRRSFWIQREYLIQAIRDNGFDLVMEQFDSLGSNLAESLLHGDYTVQRRGTFIGIKT